MVNLIANPVSSNTVNEEYETWNYVYPDEAWEGVEVRDFVLTRLDKLIKGPVLTRLDKLVAKPIVKNAQKVWRILTDMRLVGEKEVNADDVMGNLHEADRYGSDLSKCEIWV